MSIEKSRNIPKGDVRLDGGASGFNWEDVEAHPFVAERMIERLKEAGLNIDENSTLLEIGSGPGRLLQLFKEKSIKIVGVDARPRATETVPQVQARIERLPFADASFDAVIGVAAFDSAAYKQNQEMMFEEITRVLKSGGVLYTVAGDIDRPPQKLKEITKHSEALYERLFKKQ